VSQEWPTNSDLASKLEELVLKGRIACPQGFSSNAISGVTRFGANSRNKEDDAFLAFYLKDKMRDVGESGIAQAMGSANAYACSNDYYEKNKGALKNYSPGMMFPYGNIREIGSVQPFGIQQSASTWQPRLTVESTVSVPARNLPWYGKLGKWLLLKCKVYEEKDMLLRASSEDRI
jgi:hypothetical protein